MAILVNVGQRGFVLKEGLVAPGQQITVDQETAEKLSRVYPAELKLVMPDKEVVKEVVAPVLEAKEEPIEEQPKKVIRRGGKKKKEAK